MVGSKTTVRPRVTDPSVVVFLSLYLLLLAFFILLNSLSQPVAERTDAALGSIDATFRSPLETIVQSRTATSTPGSVVGPDKLQPSLRKLFETTLPVARFRVLEDGNIIRVSAPVSSFFEPDSDRLRLTRHDLMDGIAAGLVQAARVTRFEIEFRIGTGKTLPTPRWALDALPIRRAAGLARDLRRRGVAGDLIGTGVTPGARDRIVIFFRARPQPKAGSPRSAPEDTEA